MTEVRLFSYIPKKIPRHKILKRLGYNSRTIEISGESMNEVDRAIQRASDLVNLKGTCIRKGFTSEAGTVIIEADEGCIGSVKLCGLLENSDQMLLMGLTGGPDVAAEIVSLQKAGRMTEAVVIDAAAGEIVDEGFEWLATLYSGELRREARSLTTRRFSAGYGDFDLGFQEDMFRLLELDRIGVEITESCILIPEKSVTAVYGIVKPAN
jgi:hypothetical protein